MLAMPKPSHIAASYAGGAVWDNMTPLGLTSGVRHGFCNRAFSRHRSAGATKWRAQVFESGEFRACGSAASRRRQKSPGAVYTDFFAARRLRANSRSRANRANCGAKSSYRASPDIINRMAVNAYVLGSCCVYRLISSVPIIAT